MGNSQTFLACRECDSPQFDECRICSVCGPVNGLYKGNPLSDGNTVAIICEKCHSAIESDVPARLPQDCLYCASTDLGCRELNTLRWVQSPSIVDDDGSDIWITGDFDGNYSGSLRGDSGGLLDRKQAFSILINNGKPYNPKRVKGPPLKRRSGEVKPLFQGEVNPVEICEGEPNSHSVKTVYIGQLQVSGPFGQEMLIAIVSPQPLFKAKNDAFTDPMRAQYVCHRNPALGFFQNPNDLGLCKS